MLPRIYKLSLIVSGVKATVVWKGHKHKGGQIHHPLCETYMPFAKLSGPCNHTSVIAGDCGLVGQFEHEIV